MPLVSVVMVCYNRRDDVREGLKRLSEQSYGDIEVIAVDNASTDGTREMIREEFPPVRVIEIPVNAGVAAYNAGFRAARGKYVLILDDDSFPAADAIGRMVEEFERDPLMGVAAFDVRDVSTMPGPMPRQIEEPMPRPMPKPIEEPMGGISAPNIPARGAAVASNGGIATTSKSVEVSASNGVGETGYIMSFHGAGAGVRREVIERVGGYPEEFFLYFNETDMALRIWDAGYTIKSFPDIVAYHKSSRANRTSERAPFYYTRNLLWLVWKNYPAGMAASATFKILYYIFYFTLEQRTTVYLRALFNAVVNARTALVRRRPVGRDTAKRMRIHIKSAFTMYG
jgi:hypothetical protein